MYIPYKAITTVSLVSATVQSYDIFDSIPMLCITSPRLILYLEVCASGRASLDI